MHILLTNDDSHDSPLFLLAITILQSFGDLSVVVPAEEQSWKGKSMTRFSDLYVDRIDLHGTPAWSVTLLRRAKSHQTPPDLFAER